MLISERECKAILLFNFFGSIAYIFLSLYTCEIVFAVCAAIFLVSLVISIKTYLTLKWCKKIKMEVV